MENFPSSAIKPAFLDHKMALRPPLPVRSERRVEQRIRRNGRWLDFYFGTIMNAVQMKLMVDGRIVVLGTCYGATPVAIARIKPDDTDDACFGDAACSTGGLVRPPQLADVGVAAFALQSGGGIVIAGLREDKDDRTIRSTSRRPAARSCSDSRPPENTTFRVDGIRELDVSASFPGQSIDQRISGTLLHGDGIVIAGSVASTTEPSRR